ncbi:MAG: SAM-dependent methyltransferase [Alphaproteobacteria bacterium]|jgi:SAM-dependent methyltransferase
MSQEILDLLYFYRSSIGQVTFKIILNIIHKLWDQKPEKLVGIGYCDPFLDVFHKQASQCLALTPSFTGMYARSGLEIYPTALIEETNLPLRPDSQSHILCLHIIEHIAHPEIFLQEVFKSLNAEGEVIFIVPNRHGSWARDDNTPFGSGQPYSRKQLYRLIQKSGFIITDYKPTLFTSPSGLSVSKYYSHFLEIIGRFLLPRYSGLHIIRALKRVYVPPIMTQKSDILKIIPDFGELLPAGKPLREKYKE